MIASFFLSSVLLSEAFRLLIIAMARIAEAGEAGGVGISSSTSSGTTVAMSPNIW